MLRSLTPRRAFTMIEVMMVLIILGVLAAVVIPKFGTVRDDAKSSAAQAALGGVRAAIAGFRTKSILSGGSGYPTLTQLTTTGTVLQTDMPTNPFNSLANVQLVTLAQANARTTVSETTCGWNYYVDNTASPPVAIFYANSTTVTNVPKSGGYKGANEL